MSERGSASVLGLGLAALLIVLAVVLGTVGQYLGAWSRAHAAADAAALAAAPMTFRSFGNAHEPVREAAHFAAANGARLVRCECRIDRTWSPRTVEVEVELPVELMILGRRAVRAVARAEFVPVDLIRGSLETNRIGYGAR